MPGTEYSASLDGPDQVYPDQLSTQSMGSPHSVSGNQGLGTNVSIHQARLRAPWTDAASSYSAARDDVPTNQQEEISGPIARPFLEFHLLRRLTESCVTKVAETIVCLHVSSGLILIGMSAGTVFVFDLAQRLRCICSSPGEFGAVTALNLSNDGSCAGVGYASGHIVLFDLLESGKIIRHVSPTTIAEVQAGRCEGHLYGVPLTHLQFVASRRTAIVTSDTHGLCMYHSLGRILGFSSNDTHLIYGDYNFHSKFYDSATLPNGTACWADDHHFVAILADNRIHLIALAPSPRTWYTSEAGAGDTGALAWFPASPESPPMLAAALGTSLRVLYLRTARVKNVEENTLQAFVVDTEALDAAPESIVRLQWVHRSLLFVMTHISWLLYDFNARAYTEWQPYDPEVAQLNGASLYIWRSRGFCLASDRLYIGRFIPWDDKLKKLVVANEYAKALELGASFYAGHGLGSGIGLPPPGEARQKAISECLGNLQLSACHHVFRTEGDAKALAHALVAVVAATGVEELTREWYDLYELHGAEDILVSAMEEYILIGALRQPPPAAMQRMLEYCAREHQYSRLEGLVLHVEPTSLDLEQTLQLCGAHRLWGALIYLYNNALDDYITPITELLRGALLIRRPEDTWVPSAELADAYRLFPYLGAILGGRSYPGLVPMPREQAERAAASVGKVLYTMYPKIDLLDGEYPLLSLALQFDSGSMLGVLDEVFEGDLFSDGETDTHLPSREQVITALLYVRRSGTLSPSNAAFVSVFVARNAPKFPQFVRLANADVEDLFDSLCASDGVEPRSADLEYALECLLSAYPVYMSSERVSALERAQFWHVLETVFRRTRNWDALLSMYMHGNPIGPAPGQLYERGISVLKAGAHTSVLHDHAAVVADTHLGDLALLADQRVDHRHMLELLSGWRQFLYLRALFTAENPGPNGLFSTWCSLVASYAPEQLVELTDIPGADMECVRSCALEHGVTDSLIWACYRLGKPVEGLEILCNFAAEQARSLVVLSAADSHASGGAHECALGRTRMHMDTFAKTFKVALGIAIENANNRELWYLIFRSLLEFFGTMGDGNSAVLNAARSGAHKLLEAALAAMATAPPDTLVYPSLLERLLETNLNIHARAAIRAVVDGMFDTHRLRRDMLALGLQLEEADVARLFRELARVRALGILVPQGPRTCQKCGIVLGSALFAAPGGILRHHSCIE